MVSCGGVSVVLTGVRTATAAIGGATGFLTRLPVGRSTAAWEAFRSRPATMVPVAYPLGALVALAVLLPLPAATVGILLPAWIVALAGINHLDGVADCGDAAAVHGDTADRRAVMADSAIGVGGVAAAALVVAGLALAGAALAEAPPTIAVAVVIAAEVGAKLGMVGLVCLGTATHDGMGSALAGDATPAGLAVPVAVALPATALSWPSAAAGAALVGGAVATAGVLWWSRRALGGVNGDVFGAANELARVAGLHAGVIAWTAL